MGLRWRRPEPLPDSVDRALQAFTPPLRSVLFGRGFQSAVEARHFLSKSTDRLHDPFELPGMEQATGLLLKAMEAKTPIVVYGDYDADGVTATALLLEFLRSLGGRVTHYLPDRFEEGYGLNRQAVRRLAAEGCQLLLTVDCGVRALSEVEEAKSAGMSVLLTDHHHPGASLPAADSIVNPRLPTASYPFPGLAGVGLAYKLAQALAVRLGRKTPEALLDLVALGTVADLAPLVDENRVLVARGLEVLNRGGRPGLEALRGVARLASGRVTSTNIAFGLGPRLNAAGRMESAEQALALLLAQQESEAKPAADHLNRLNRQRQQETRDGYALAQEVLGPEGGEQPVLLVRHPSFHDGVVGLVASRLTESYYRPALVAREDAELVKGSARSIPGYHITEALETCSDLLLDFGGHAAAAGFSLKKTDFADFHRRLQAHAEATFGEEPPERTLEIDAIVQLNEMNEEVLAGLDEFEPFGQGNEAPVFATYGVRVLDMRPVGRDGSHLKMTLSDGGRGHEAIAFRLGDRAGRIRDRVDLAFRYEWNEYLGHRSPQLNVVDLKPTGGEGGGG